LTDLNIINLDPKHFVFWQPPAGHMIHVGPDQHPIHLPQIPLPIKRTDLEANPSDNSIGEGAYDYLRQFPDCLHNVSYALLLREGYAHYLADLAAHVVMLDAKDVEPAYIFRKLTYLKILLLLDPDNSGLLTQLSQGFYDLAMTFTELPQVHRHLLEAMRFGQDLLKLKADDQAALNLLAEVDILFGDYPAAITKLRRLLASLSDHKITGTDHEITETDHEITGTDQKPARADQKIAERIEARLESCLEVGFPDHPLVNDLERIGDAMQLYAAKDYSLATELLERLEEDDYFMSELKSTDFLCLLGMCRIKTEDRAGAFDALSQALEIDPDHEQARKVIESI
jgi:tetratricopeptide (TPR) repeat protein